MDTPQIIDLVGNVGVPLTIAIVAGIALWKQTIFLQKENTKREERYADIIENHLKTSQEILIRHDQRATVAIEGMQRDAAQRQQEHMKMLEALAAITESVRSIPR